MKKPTDQRRPMIAVENVVYEDMRRARTILQTAFELASEYHLPADHIFRAKRALQRAIETEARLHPWFPEDDG